MKDYTDYDGNLWETPNKPMIEMPMGTKAKAIGGGHWIRVKTGWKWCTGSTFPTVGGDWNGQVCYPK